MVQWRLEFLYYRLIQDFLGVLQILWVQDLLHRLHRQVVQLVQLFLLHLEYPLGRVVLRYLLDLVCQGGLDPQGFLQCPGDQSCLVHPWFHLVQSFLWALLFRVRLLYHEFL